jgi:hypothetical protein
MQNQHLHQFHDFQHHLSVPLYLKSPLLRYQNHQRSPTTFPPFNITIDSEVGATWIKKVSAKVEMMQAENEARIDVLGLAQGLKGWRVKEETRAKIEVIRKESEALLETMRNESECRFGL